MISRPACRIFCSLYMKIFKQLICIVAATAFAVPAYCGLNLPTKTIGNTTYYYYVVQNKDDLNTVAQKIGVSADDIVRNNPSAGEGLAVNQKLYFPVEQFASVTPTGSRTHTVTNGETLYGIARQYGVTVDQLIELNPQSNYGVSPGMVLALPGSVTPGNDLAQNSQNNYSSSADNDDAPDQQVRNAFARNDRAQNPQNNYSASADYPQHNYSTRSEKPIYHTIQPGENIYSVAKRYNAGVEGIMIANPTLRPADYVAGQQIQVTPNSALPFYYESDVVRNYEYVVRDGENYASIARANGISEKELKAANPKQRKAKKGKTIIVPRHERERVRGDIATMSQAELEAYYAPRIDAIYEHIIGSKNQGEVNIAMVLPFQLHKTTPPRQAYLYTDFYRGFLIALDSMRYHTNKRINLRVFDTRHNLNVTDSILSLPQMRQQDVIIAPLEPQQLQRINEFGRRNNVKVINCFTTKNDDFRDNAQVVQVNPTTQDMTAAVLRWFDQKFGDCEVIFLDDPNNEDKEIFGAIRQHIYERNQRNTTVRVGGDLSYNAINAKMDPGSKYIFIPSSQNKDMLKRIIPALKQAKRERFDCDLYLIGWPEYVLYLKDYQTDLQDIDTYMFSRFFNSKGFRSRDVETQYNRWFPGRMLESVPNMMLYGFDTGMYLISTLGNDTAIDENAPLYKGIQTPFKFERHNNWSGSVQPGD